MITDLRSRAEASYSQRNKSDKKLYDQDVNALIHEPEVHQIELELQNEELRRVQAELNTSLDRYFRLYDLAHAGYFTFV